MSEQGLANLGGTCAINSLIQMLYRQEKFRTIILNSNTEEGTITNELKDLFNVLNNNKSINPNRFITKFYDIFSNNFNKYEENDICEIYLILIEKIHNELSYDYIINDDNNNLINKIAKFNNNKYSSIYELLQGIYIHAIKCLKCNYINNTFEPFIYINLNINGFNSISNLINNQYFSNNNEFRNKDTWKCDNCNCNSDYIKATSIIKLPKIIFISLNRFKEIVTKNVEPVSIDKKLIFNNQNKYNLHSIAFHHGNLNGGHYNAICKINENENENEDKFNIYDDLNVCFINNIDAILNNNSNCYLISYYYID